MTTTVVPGLPASRRRAPGLIDRAVASAALRAARGVRGGTLELRGAVGRRRYGAGEPVVEVEVHDPRALAALRRGSRGLGEGYVEGWWDCDDLTGLVRLLARSVEPLGSLLDGAGAVVGRAVEPAQRRRRRGRQVDERNVRAHYDIGNEFFELLLDPTMTYSCAVFDRPGMTLAEASTAKLDRICRKLGLGPAHHVVEIGTGWGSFALHAAGRYGCRVTTTTISARQHEHASKRVEAAGLADRVTVLDADFRDLDGRFDRLVSVEMIEALDWRDQDGFFEACARLLDPEGLAVIQAIVIRERSLVRSRHHRDFIKESIFPGGYLPSVGSITSGAVGAGLHVVDVEDIGRHYAETLRRWRANLEAHAEAIGALGFDERFRRLWRLYLAYCEASFLERRISDVQVVLAGAAWRAPLSPLPR